MPSRTSLLVLLGLMLAATGGVVWGALAADASPVIGWIEIAPVPQKSDQINIVGHAYALEPVAGKFTLSIKRSGKGGSSTSGQSGSFKLDAGENGSLSRTAINVGPADTLTIELKLTVDNTEVFSVLLRPALGSGARKI